MGKEIIIEPQNRTLYNHKWCFRDLNLETQAPKCGIINSTDVCSHPKYNYVYTPTESTPKDITKY